MAKRKRKNSKTSSPPSISPPDSPAKIKIKPNASASDPGTSSKPYPPQVNNKLWNRFYEPLVLLAAYGKSQGDHIKPKEIVCQDDNRPLIQKFLDQLAYICDYASGGDTVTAIAVQDGPRLTYWVAANENTSSKVTNFLNGILQALEKVYNASGDEILTIRNQITDEVVEFCSKKLCHYRSRLLGHISMCLRSLEKQSTKEAEDLKQWLLPFRDNAADLKTLTRLCYEARNSETMKALTHRADAGTMQRNSASQNTEHSRIRHLVGRLGSHIKAAAVLVDVGRYHPQLFTDYSIEVATGHPNFVPPAYQSKSSINGIINRMVKDPSLCRYYQNEIHSQDQKFNLELEARIRKEYKDPSLKLRVHAEIIILDLFYRKDFQFLNRMRYIGVSKPSCFLCYRYVQAHPLRAQTSGCSNNLYLKWQPPYVHEDSPPLVKDQEDILNAMIQEIRQFVLDTVVPGFQGFKSHPDSTTGIDTVWHTNEVPYDLNPTETKPEQDILAPEAYIDVSAHSPLNSDVVDAVGEPNDGFGGGVSLSQSFELQYASIVVVVAILSIFLGWIIS